MGMNIYIIIRKYVISVLQTLTSRMFLLPDQAIWLNMLLSDVFMSDLNSELGCSTWEFHALQLIVLVMFGVAD